MSICSIPSCKKKATFNIKGREPLFCSTHRTEHMLNVMKNICEFKDCYVKAIFGYLDQPAIRCKLHILADMVNHNYKYCEHKGCHIRSCYGFPNKKASACAKHKEPGMKPIKSRRCAEVNCTVRNPCFNFAGVKPGIYCSIHKQSNMVDVQHPICESQGCLKQPAYDIRGGKGRFCAEHKLPNMIDIVNAYCAYAGCTVVNPIFNFQSESKGKFCFDHKESTMVDVKHNTCEEKGCQLRPNYNIKGEKGGRFCKEHKQDGMVDVSHATCEFEDCSTRPNYGFKGENGRRCVKHKLPNMIDLMNKTCSVEQCLTRARYGHPGIPAIRCTQHREMGMIAFPTARCKQCKKSALWGKDMKLLHCDEHKQGDEQNIVERPCKSCNLMSILDMNDLCEHCHPGSFIRATLAKQKSLMAYLDHRGLCGTTTDKRIDNGSCGNERPDRIFELDDKVIIIECDEYQHKDRPCECEQTRMVNIGQSFGGTPVYFIRFNPDDYQSPYQIEPNASLIQRYQLCGDLIQSILQRSISLPNALVSSIYLYFDKWNGIQNEEWHIITPLD
jgi:EsV-1-7 cysteine-rich motif